MRRSRRPFMPGRAIPILAFVVALCFSAASAHAYNPPVDTAGPLTVRIEGPEEVTQAEVPLPILNAVGISSGSDRMSTTSAVSMATSVPALMAMPRSACARAGAPLRPSRRSPLAELHVGAG